MKNKIGFILGIIISFVGLAATIMLALHTPLMIAFQYWWAFFTGIVISGTVLVFCIISLIADIVERKRRK
ncbi:MAG: hypothetical protein KHX91_09320 [Clostridium sp.]|nr:hypothetical protein [Clostridium sp.]